MYYLKLSNRENFVDNFINELKYLNFPKESVGKGLEFQYLICYEKWI